MIETDVLKSENGGRLDLGVLFPDISAVDLDARLEAYIAEGYAQAAAVLSDAAAIDRATTAWAYYRAFDAVFVRLSATPSSVALNDQGSSSFLGPQIQNFRDLSDQALAEYGAELENQGAAPTIADGWSVSQSFRHA